MDWFTISTNQSAKFGKYTNLIAQLASTEKTCVGYLTHEKLSQLKFEQSDC